MRENQPPATAVRQDRPARRGSFIGCVGIGALVAIFALLPWLLTGMRLPLQDLWATQTLPADMPVALLPLSQYGISDVLSIVVVGYGIAGVLVRVRRSRSPRGAASAVAAGVLVVHLIAAIQALTTVASGLRERTASDVYLAALAAVVVVSVLVGLLVLRLIVAPARAAALLGLSGLALVTGMWLAALLVTLGVGQGSGASLALVDVGRWIPAVLVGAAIGWGGCTTPGRIAASLFSLVLLWVVPAAVTALTSAAGSRVLLPYPREMAAYGTEVLHAAAFDSALVLPPLELAVVVAAAGLALSLVLRRRVVSPTP